MAISQTVHPVSPGPPRDSSRIETCPWQLEAEACWDHLSQACGVQPHELDLNVLQGWEEEARLFLSLSARSSEEMELLTIGMAIPQDAPEDIDCLRREILYWQIIEWMRSNGPCRGGAPSTEMPSMDAYALCRERVRSLRNGRPTG